MSEVLVFDVNETLLDLGALDPLFDDVLGDAALRSVWFATMLQVAFVGGLTGHYVDFTTAQKAALHMVAARARRTIDDDDVETIVAAMRRLPPHPDARPALERLHDAGYRLTALTNSVLDVAEDQLVHAGLADLFEGVYSADTVRALKPLPRPYGMVAERSRVPISQLRLVAAHAWDVTGALAAGARAAFVARAGAVPTPHGLRPDVVGDLTAVADQLLANTASS